MPKRLVIDVPDPDHAQIKAAVAAAGWSISALVLRLLQMWLEGKIKVGQPPGRGKE